MSTRNTSTIPLEVRQLEERDLMTVSAVLPPMNLGTALVQLDKESAEMTLAQAQVDSLHSEITSLHLVYQGHQSAAGTMQRELASTQMQLDAALASHTGIATTIESLTGNISTLSTEQGEIQSRVPAIEQDIAHLQEQIAQWNTARTDLTATLNTLEARMRDLRTQFAQEDATVTQRTDDVTAKKSAVVKADTTLKNDQNALKTATDSLAQAQTTLKTAQDTLAADQKKLSDAQTALTKATKNYNDIYKLYGKITTGKYPQMVKDAKTAMDNAKATVDALTLTVKKDQDAVTAAKTAVDNWTKARDAAAAAVPKDTDILKQAQTALDTAVQALDAAVIAGGQTTQKIADLQPQIDDVHARIADCDRALTGLTATLDGRNGDLGRAQSRLAEILRLLEDLQSRLGEAQSTETGLTQVISNLRAIIDAERSAFDGALAEIGREQGWISTKEDALFSTELQAQKETEDVEAMQKIVADLIQLMLIEQQAANAACNPRVHESTILSRPSVEVIKNGDWLDLHTSGFDGKQSFTFGNARITPEVGNHIITIPGFYAPETLRDNIPELQTMLNHQTNAMPWVEVPAPATAAADLFSPSVLGTWRADIIAADGTASPVSLTQPTTNALGTTGLTGVMPDGAAGRELTAATPLMTITRPTAQTIRMQIENMPAGCTIDVSRWFQTGGKTAYKTATTSAGTFSMDLDRNAQDGQKGYFWVLSRPDGSTVRDGSLLMNQEMTPLMLTAITTPLPAGTHDLPLSIVSNGNSAATALDQSGGIRPVAPGSLLVHPMKGKDVRLSFTPTGESRVMPHGTITHLDTRGGDGVTVTLIRRRPDGSSYEPWIRKLENGGTLDFGSLPEPFFGMGIGYTLELTISSDSNDLCDSVSVDVQFAVESPRCATATGIPMGVIAPTLQNRIGGDMIVLTDPLSRGPVNFNSSNDDIARWIVGSGYDTMDPNIKSDYRAVVDNAKAAMYPSYVSAMKDAFMDVLMERNGVVRPRRSGGFVDPTGHNYHTAIPNAPTWGDFYVCAEQQFEKCYSTYERLVGDSGTLMTAQKLQEQQTARLENGLHNALADAGLVSVQSSPPSSRSLADQRKLDGIFTQFTGAPDRAGWTVADQENLGRMVAMEAGGVVDTWQPDSGMTGQTDQEKSLINFLSVLPETERENLIEDFAMASYGVERDLVLGQPIVVASLTSTDVDPATKRLANLNYLMNVAPGAKVWGPLNGELRPSDFTGDGLKVLANGNPYQAVQKIRGAAEIFQSMLQDAKTRNGFNVNDNAALKMYHQSLGMQLQNNDDVSTNHDKLQNKIFYHIPASSPITQGKLVIIFLGNSQTLADSQAGVDARGRVEAAKNEYEILEFRVGDLMEEIKSIANIKDAFALHPDIIFERTKTIIQDRIAGRGMFAGLPAIREVVCEAYSWGAGTASKLFSTPENVKTLLGTAKLQAVAYVDGVQLGLTNAWGDSVRVKPETDHFFNVYQTHEASLPIATFDPSGIMPFKLQYLPNIYTGEPVHGTSIGGAEVEKNLGMTKTHVNIDETDEALQGMQFILSKFTIASF